MKKISKLVMFAVLALGLTFAACNNEDVPQTPDQLKGSSYATIAVAFPKGGPSTKALPDDYNQNGVWEGLDEIKTVTVFLVNETVGTIDYTTFTEASFESIANGVLNPKLAMKATPGDDVKAYVVVNDVNDAVTTTLKGKGVSTFAADFAGEVAKIASEVAKNDATHDIIMMTNTVAPTAVSIAANVTEAQAKAGGTNLIKVDVERVVSRAIVTIKDEYTPTIEIKSNNVVTSTITISDVTYSVGQSNTAFYGIKKTTWMTPYSDWALGTTSPAYSDVFDNSKVASLATVQAIASKANADVIPALVAEKADSKFVLPVVHANDKYQKGNTTYFEVQATFAPDKVDGSADYAGGEVYLGANDGLFYSTRVLAETSGQKSTRYAGADGKFVMKYVLWLNPDIVPGTGGSDKASMSPTVRNQVYHAHITGFKTIGVPNNPLNPEDPENPKFVPEDPDNPDGPQIPDPEDPNTGNPKNPIDPEDPLETEDTYLSVQITVLDYTVHSYEVDLGQDY